MAKRCRSVSPATASVGSRLRSEGRPPISLFIFRRDHRLTDNTALIKLAAVQPGVPILPAFFFNPAQIDPAKNPYFGSPCVQFMMESLKDLNQQLDNRLVLLHGTDDQCVETLQEKFTVLRIGFNKDYTPFAKTRDLALESWCAVKGIEVVTSPWDYSLLPLDGVLSGSNKPYAVFTPYYNKCMSAHMHQIPKVAPLLFSKVHWISADHKQLLAAKLADSMLSSVVPSPNDLAPVVGGRAAAMKRLHEVLPTMGNYEVERDHIHPQKTSMLSPYLKFGCVSVREVFTLATELHGVRSVFVKELFWREFYAMLLYNHPQMCLRQVDPTRKNLPFQEKFAAFEWKWSESHWNAFQQGKTGVPLVDAAVRCLNATGWCHNRNRMVIGSFATKVLFVDWRVCEEWYARKAIDYDPASNSGGWQWCSGQGADAMPYFRTFNPFAQAKKFDESCTFIKRWIPELSHIDAKIIHAWDEKGTDDLSKLCQYPRPILNIKAATKDVIAEFGKY